MSQFTSTDIHHAQPYWLERKPFTVNVTSIPAGGTYTLFSVKNWNSQTNISQLAELTQMAISNLHGLRIDVSYDDNSWTGYAQGFPNNLQMMNMGFKSVSKFSLVLTNTTTSTMSGIFVNYLITIWTMNVTYKVLENYAISPVQAKSAKALGISTSTVDQSGTYPIPLDTTIERTYKNRRIGHDIVVANRYSTSTSQSTIYQEITTNDNELLVLTNVGFSTNAKYGVTITVDRDSQSDELTLNGENLTMAGIDMLMPANNHLTFYIQATTATPSTVPVNITIWHLSMSNILRTRMGILSLSDIEVLFSKGAVTSDQITKAHQAADKFYNEVIVGIR